MATIEPKFLNESQVKSYLSWPKVYHAVQQALLSVSSNADDMDQPNSSQPARTLTSVNSSGITYYQVYIGFKFPNKFLIGHT